MKFVYSLLPFIALTSCVVPKSYDQIAHIGISKYELFDEASKQSLDFQQIYYDEETSTEVFFLRSANWWNDDDVGLIPVFESVSKPTECPFSSRGGRCQYILYPDLPTFERPPYMGNGILKSTYRTDELYSLAAQGDPDAGYLLAAYQIYVEKRDAEVDTIMKRRGLDETYRYRAEIEWYEAGKDYDERQAHRKVAATSNAYPVEPADLPPKPSTTESAYGGRVSKTGHSTSLSGADLFDTLIDTAITLWLYDMLDIPLPGQISEANLREIEAAAARGAARGARSRSAQDQAMRNIQRMYCNNNKGSKYSIHGDC